MCPVKKGENSPWVSTAHLQLQSFSSVPLIHPKVWADLQCTSSKFSVPWRNESCDRCSGCGEGTTWNRALQQHRLDTTRLQDTLTKGKSIFVENSFVRSNFKFKSLQIYISLNILDYKAFPCSLFSVFASAIMLAVESLIKQTVQNSLFKRSTIIKQSQRHPCSFL